MTGATEQKSGVRIAGSSLTALAAPALVLLAIVVPFLTYHQYNLLLPESLMLVAGALAIGTFAGAVSLLRPRTLGPALVAVTLCVYIYYRPEVTDRLLLGAHAIADFTGGFGTALGCICAALFLSLYLVCRTVAQHLSTIVTAIFGTILASTLLLPTATGGEAVEAGRMPAALANLPPMIHIVLDEHIGLAGLPPELPESSAAASAMRNTYRDFGLYSRAYSRFAETQYALASLMNASDASDVQKLLRVKGGRYTLLENAWFDRLKAQGYAIKVYQTDRLDMCGDMTLVDTCYTYSLYSPNPMQRSSLSTGARLRVLFRKLNFGDAIPLPAPLAASEALDRFRSDIGEAPRGVSYIVHLLLPHEGFLYRADCSILDPADWEGANRLKGLSVQRRADMYRLYLQHLVCTGRKIDQLFNELREKEIYDDATILVHGDHGSRIGEQPWITQASSSLSKRDLIDHFATLLAVKAPGTTPGIQPEPALLQQVFADSFLQESIGKAATSAPVFIRDPRLSTFGSRTLDWPQSSETAWFAKPGKTQNPATR